MIQNQSFNIALVDDTPGHKMRYSLTDARKERMGICNHSKSKTLQKMSNFLYSIHEYDKEKNRFSY
jgi:dTDP-D-glucose 4,6-dehydratase